MMKVVRRKIRKLYEIFKLDIWRCKNFGFTIAMIDFCSNTLFRHTHFGQRLEKIKYRKAKLYLYKQYRDMILEHKNRIRTEKNIETNTINKTIWVLWWQGENARPPIVTKCIDSIKQHSSGWTVKELSKDNYFRYVNIPDYIIQKVDVGKISLTHFSDILRMYLLYENGGIWMDATLFLSEDLKMEIAATEFYTIRHGLFTKWHICSGKWSGFFIAGSRNNILFEFCKDMLSAYWEKEDALIVYLLIDCIIAIGYEEIEGIRKMVDNVPINNTGIFRLQNNFEERYSEEQYTDILKNTYIHKLSYKREYKTENRGKQTVFNYWMKNN